MLKQNFICDWCKRENLSENNLYQLMIDSYTYALFGPSAKRLDLCKDCTKKISEILGIDLVKMGEK